jgi:hypothetical protein
MPKYRLLVTFHSHSIVIDTDEYEDDFAKTKDDLVDKLDPNDPDAVHDWFADTWHDHGLIDLYEIDVDQVEVKPKT